MEQEGIYSRLQKLARLRGWTHWPVLVVGCSIQFVLSILSYKWGYIRESQTVAVIQWTVILTLVSVIVLDLIGEIAFRMLRRKLQRSQKVGGV